MDPAGVTGGDDTRPAPRSFVRLLLDGVDRYGDRVAVVDPQLGLTVTYRELAAGVEAAAAALLGHGLTAGDRVAVLARNGLEQVVAVLACSRAGLVHLGLPAEDPPERLRAVVELAGPRLLLAQADLGGVAEQVVAGAGVDLQGTGWLLGGLPGAVREGLGPVPDGLGPVPVGPGPTGLWPVPDDAAATYALVCTSGSTGRPKLVRVTGAMSDTAARTYTHLLGLGPEDRTAVHLPLWWVSGHITQLASSLHSGGAVVTMPRWSPGELVRVVAEHGVTWLDLVPTLWHGLLREDGFRAPRLPALRAAVFGGAPASPEVLAAVRARVPGLDLHDAYAMSELPAPITCLVAADATTHAGTVGRVQPHATLRLLDPAGGDVPTGEQGAVVVRSQALTPGYVGPDALAVQDGWFRTGDLGRLDAEGYLSITGRLADVINRGGVKVHPVEVERALVASGLVEAALVVGVPARLHGEDVAALVVPAGAVDRGAEGTLDGVGDVAALRAAVRSRLGVHAVPVRVVAVAALPRNGNGKPDRAAARQLLG